MGGLRRLRRRYEGIGLRRLVNCEDVEPIAMPVGLSNTAANATGRFWILKYVLSGN